MAEDNFSNKIQEMQDALKERERLISRLEQRENASMSKQIEYQVRAEEYEKRRHNKKSRAAKLELDIQRKIGKELNEAIEREKKEIVYFNNQIKLLNEKQKIQEEAAAKAAKARIDQAEGLRQFEKSFRMIPGIGGAIAHAFDKAADIIEEGGSGMKAMLILGKNFLHVLGPAAILKTLFDVNKELGLMHTQLGVGFDSAQRMREEFAQIAQSSNDTRITSTKLVKAQIDLTNQLGFVTQFSGENLKNFINTTEYLGASAESAAKLQVLSAATGKSVDAFTEGLAGAAQQSEKTYGIHLPLKNVVEAISKMQGATLAYIADQPKELVKAVAISQKLGLSFEKIRSIADGLVNFESSITAELEAEVMLGRDINLNKARQLAFLGKEADLGKELLNQVGSLADFNAMLPIQQESFAKALGMSRDEMAGVLMQQEMIAKYGDKAATLSREQLENAKQIAKQEGISVDAALVKVNSQVDATKKFEDAALKIRSAVQDLVVQLSPIIDKLADFIGRVASSPLVKVGVTALAGLGSISALFNVAKAFRGVSPSLPLFTSEVGAGGGLSGAFGRNVLRGAKRGGGLGTLLGKNTIKGAAGAGYRLGSIAKGAGIAGIAGMGISALGTQAAKAGQEGLAKGLGAGGGALSGAAMGAAIGSIIPGFGTALGAAIGGLYGGVTGYLDKQEAVRDAKRAEIQKEIDERGAVADELRQIRELMNQEGGVYIDSDRVGTSLMKGAALVKPQYNI